jgi:hypothetical protein
MPASKDVFGSKVNLLSQGMTTNFTPKNSLTVLGQAMTQVQIVAQLTAIKGRDTAANLAKSAWTVAVAAKKNAMPEDKKFVAALIAVIKQTFGDASPLLASFGIALPKPKTARTAIQKAVTTALSKNTRVVRGIMSAKERQSITTTGKPGVVVVAPSGQPLLTVGAVPPGSSAPPTVTVGATPPAASSTPDASTGTGSPTAAPAPAASTPSTSGK